MRQLLLCSGHWTEAGRCVNSHVFELTVIEWIKLVRGNVLKRDSQALIAAHLQSLKRVYYLYIYIYIYIYVYILVYSLIFSLSFFLFFLTLLPNVNAYTEPINIVVQKSSVRELHATPLHERAAWQQLDTQIRFVKYQLQSEHAQFLVSQLQAANSQYYAQFNENLWVQHFKGYFLS